MTGLTAWLAALDADRRRHGLHRALRARSEDGALLDLAGNDYLGLARDRRVVAAAADAARRWGAGATGSRLVTGTTGLHAELERDLAAFTGAAASLVFASGYAANLGVVQALTDSDTLVVSDAGNHASLIDGCRLSRATVAVTPHADADAVDRVLARRARQRALVVTDAVFSVDGDVAPLADLHEACRRHDALLLVDEAHAFGVLGPGGAGLAAAAGLAGEPDVIRTVTLSKALGSQGGAVLATAPVVDHLVNTARTFIFDTGLAPPSAGAALQALRIVTADPGLPAEVRRRAADLAAGLGAPPPDAAVVSVLVGGPDAAVRAAERCRARAVVVGCFRPPSVPDRTSRLRITARADLTDDDVTTATVVILDAVRQAA